MGNIVDQRKHVYSPAEPTVSVVLPVFNGERTIRQAIDSVLAQTFSDLELLIWNDCSTDETESIVGSYSDPRIVALGGSENIGPGYARDAAITMARGKWVAVIDADDAWLPWRLERLLEAAGKRRDIMVFDDIVDCHDSPKGLPKWRRVRGGQAFGANGVAPVTVDFREFISQRRLLIKPLFPLSVVSEAGLQHSACQFGEDTEYFLRLIEQGLQLVYVPDAMYLYRITPASLSANPVRDELMLGILIQARERMALEPADLHALECKIARVSKEIRYAPFLQAVKGRHWCSAFAMLLKHPGLLLEFVTRLPENILYRLHRWFHQAEGR